MVLISGANLNAKVARRPGVDEDDEVAVSGACWRSAMAASTWSSWPSRCRAQGGRRRLRPSFRKKNIIKAVSCIGSGWAGSWAELDGFGPGKFFPFFSVSSFSFICFVVFGFLT
jgi:hypothetical protein